MSVANVVRRSLRYFLAACGIAIGAALVIGVALEHGAFRSTIVGLVSSYMGRVVQVDGALEVRIFSWHPGLTASAVTVANPPWTPSGTAAEIGQVEVEFAAPSTSHWLRLKRLVLSEAFLHLIRDASGRANWQRTDPALGPGAGLPVIAGLAMADAHLDVDDDRRHVRFTGRVSVGDPDDPAGLNPFKLSGRGELNGRLARFEIVGAPLGTANEARPYAFSFTESSSGSELSGRGSLDHPLSLRRLETSFEATGADLKDLYFLTGVTLFNTGAYRLSGTLARQGLRSEFSDLKLLSGESDLRGDVRVDSSAGRPRFVADLTSNHARSADIGLRAAGREPLPADPDLLLPTVALTPQSARRSDAQVRFHARRMTIGRMELSDLAAAFTLDNGHLTMRPMSADLLGGHMTAEVRIDANQDDPPAQVDVRFIDLQLGNLGRHGADAAPLEGTLRGRIRVHGHGRSIHEVAATANGSVAFVVAHGVIRQALADLAGADTRGVRLLLAKDRREEELRCAVVTFQAHDGTLTAERLIADTDQILVSGEGSVHLDSEALDLRLRGRPKAFRLARVRAPIIVRGTLAHPHFGIDGRKALPQAAEALALGVLLTPFAAVLAFIDAGLAKDANCSELIAAADAPARLPKAGARAGT